MATDAGECLASPSHLRRQEGEALHQYYLAVDRLQFKMYSDLAESERSATMDKFCQAVVAWHSKAKASKGHKGKANDQKSFVIVVTDACLPMLAVGESPFSAHVLINYQLPTKKETYLRRMSTCLAPAGIVINMVVGGEVVTLKSIEEGCCTVIEEMPIYISDILKLSGSMMENIHQEGS